MNLKIHYKGELQLKQVLFLLAFYLIPKKIPRFDALFGVAPSARCEHGLHGLKAAAKLVVGLS